MFRRNPEAGQVFNPSLSVNYKRRWAQITLCTLQGFYNYIVNPRVSSAFLNTYFHSFYNLQRLVDMLEERTHLPAILQSLGCIAQTAMPIFETREREIIEFITKNILECSSV